MADPVDFGALANSFQMENLPNCTTVGALFPWSSRAVFPGRIVFLVAACRAALETHHASPSLIQYWLNQIDRIGTYVLEVLQFGPTTVLKYMGSIRADTSLKNQHHLTQLIRATIGLHAVKHLSLTHSPEWVEVLEKKVLEFWRIPFTSADRPAYPVIQGTGSHDYTFQEIWSSAEIIAHALIAVYRFFSKDYLAWTDDDEEFSYILREQLQDPSQEHRKPYHASYIQAAAILEALRGRVSVTDISNWMVKEFAKNQPVRALHP